MSVGGANQGLGPIRAINGTMGGRWEQLEEDGGRQWKMEHPGLSNRLLGGNPGCLKTVAPFATLAIKNIFHVSPSAYQSPTNEEIVRPILTKLLSKFSSNMHLPKGLCSKVKCWDF